MSKEKQIALRISVDEYDFVKSLGGSFTDIFQIGFNKWAMEYPDFLQKKASEYKELYIQCIAKQGKCYTMHIQKSVVLDDLYKIYVTQGRNIQSPNHEDKSWVKARLGKLDNGNKVSVQQFFDYCQKKYEAEKQKKLEVDG